MEKAIRVFVVDDHQVIYDGLKRLLGTLEDIETIGHTINPEEALSQVETLSPDIVLMDVKMPGLDGIELTRQITQKSLSCKVIMLTMYEQYVQKAMEVGAKGYLLKDIKREQLAQAIRTVHGGKAVIHESMASRLEPDYEERAGIESKNVYCRMVEEIQLVIPPPVDMRQVTRFAGRTEQLLRASMSQLVGSRQEGTRLTFKLNKPVEPVDIISKIELIPEVESITEELVAEEFVRFLSKKVTTVPNTRDTISTTLRVRLEKHNTGILNNKNVKREQALSLRC